jgi:N-methylhydantoinase A
VPGPACYGRGGTEPTVTDANLLLGRLLKDIPLAGDIQLDHEAAEHAVANLAKPLSLSTMACAEGIVRVAEAEMARALRVMTVQRGVDPREMALMPFGGAGPLHAAALARELGMRRILCPRASGVLCALGLAAASPRRDAARTVVLSGEALSSEAVRSERDALLAQVLAQARGRVVYEMRYAGQSFELGVEQDSSAPVEADLLRKRFAEKHEERYGYRDEDAEVELVTIRVSGWGEAPEIELSSATGSEPRRETRAVVFAGSTVEAQCLRGDLPPGTEVRGPAICALEQATLWVPPGWQGEVDAQGTVLLQC